MSTLRPGAPGATRECPHCRETILASAAVCPACRHHLRFDTSAAAATSAPSAISAFRVEGSIRHPADAPPWEYSVIVLVRNDRGEEIARRVVGVGAISATESRSFELRVEALPLAGKSSTRAGGG